MTTKTRLEDLGQLSAHAQRSPIAQGSSEMASRNALLVLQLPAKPQLSPGTAFAKSSAPAGFGTRLFSGAGEIAETAGEERLERLVTALPQLEVGRVQRHPAMPTSSAGAASDGGLPVPHHEI